MDRTLARGRVCEGQTRACIEFAVSFVGSIVVQRETDCASSLSCFTPPGVLFCSRLAVSNREIEQACRDFARELVRRNFEIETINLQRNTLRVLDVDLAIITPTVSARNLLDVLPCAALVVDESRARPGFPVVVAEVHLVLPTCFAQTCINFSFA